MNYLKVILVLPNYYFYYFLNIFFQSYQQKNIALNSTSLFHALSTIILSFASINYNLNSFYIFVNSGGYLVFDFIYILKKNKFDILRIMYLYHHFVVFLYILLPQKQHYWKEVMFVAELSNIPNYLVYYSLKNDIKLGIKQSNTTYILLKLQLLVYFILRIFFLGYYGLKEIYNDKVTYIKIHIYLVSILYLFGVIWFITMLKQNI